MADSISPQQGSLQRASDVAHTLTLRTAQNGIRWAMFGDLTVAATDLARIVQAVPATIVSALGDRVFYFVPLAMPASAATSHQAKPAGDGPELVPSETLVAPVYTTELADEAICHRNMAVDAHGEVAAHEGTFISARLLRDQFALAFEYLINVAHQYAASAGTPSTFSTLAWKQAAADVRGETSQDAWEFRHEALPKTGPAATPNEKAKTEYLDAAFSDALAIYMLSLALDFDYAELREREYPLLAPAALAERLRMMAELFPPNEGYDFAIRYRRR